MALSSMTGFARHHSASGAYSIEWEIKSVNAKGFDLRLRLPPGWDAVEPDLRKCAQQVLARGTVYANLTIVRANAGQNVRINEGVLESVIAAARKIATQTGASPASVDGLLAVKGVIEVAESEASEDEQCACEAAIVAGFAQCLNDLVVMRGREGAALGDVLRARLDELDDLRAKAEATPGRTADAVKLRLKSQVAELLDASDRFDADRLHQEAVLLAAKADIREELDRIVSHVTQARAHLASGGPVGRKLDFLAQEFNREVNTCCSKSNDIALTNIGLEMKNVVEQFREQVQNLE